MSRLVKQIPEEQHHGLADTWTFWCLVPKLDYSTTDWSSFLRKIVDFQSFEDFWGIMNSINKPATIMTGCRYYIFKEGIRPLWEDENNKNGFQVTCSYPNKDNKEQFAQLAESKWETLVLLLLGQMLGNYEFINGVEFNRKKSEVNIGVWTKKISDEQLEDIKHNLQHELEFTEQVKSTKIKLNEHTQ